MFVVTDPFALTEPKLDSTRSNNDVSPVLIPITELSTKKPDLVPLTVT
jgi:hypothetical protein